MSAESPSAAVQPAAAPRFALLRWLAEPAVAWSSVFADGAIVAYALWTVACHAVMLSGGNTYALAVVSAAVALLAPATFVAYLRWRARRGEPRAVTDTPAPAASVSGTAPASSTAPALRGGASVASETRARRQRLALAGGVPLVWAVWYVFHDNLIEWLAFVAYMIGAVLLTAREEVAAAPEQPRTGVRWQELSVWGLAAASAFLALFAHRWRNDDCYYINLAVTVADVPYAPLLSLQTIHAPTAGNLAANAVFTPYRVHSFEALGGLLSFVSGIEAIRVVHIGLAGAAAFMIPLVYARLLRELDRERWFYALIAVLAFYLFDGSGDRGFVNQGMVRAFTGKSVLLSVAVPMLVYRGIALGRSPTLANVLMFAAAQIATVGFSSTGLWLAPVAGMLAVAVPLAVHWRSLRTIGMGLLGCSYVVGLGLWVRRQVMSGGGMSEDDGVGKALAVHESGLRPHYDLLRSAFEQNIGPPSVTIVYLGLLLLAIPLSRTSLARRYITVFCVAVVLLLENPFLVNFLRYNLLGKYTGQRAMWVAPIPAAVGLCFAALIPATSASMRRRGAGVAAMLAALTLFFAVVPSDYVLTRKNNVVFHWPPRPKVPERAFALIGRLTEILPRGSIVLAPEMVSWYLPTVHHHPYPLLANKKYMHEPPKEERRREYLVRLVSHSSKKFPAQSRDRTIADFARYKVSAIVLTSNAVRTPGLIDAIKDAGYRRSDAGEGYQLWLGRNVAAQKYARKARGRAAKKAAAPAH